MINMVESKCVRAFANFYELILVTKLHMKSL